MGDVSLSHPTPQAALLLICPRYPPIADTATQNSKAVPVSWAPPAIRLTVRLGFAFLVDMHRFDPLQQTGYRI